MCDKTINRILICVIEGADFCPVRVMKENNIVCNCSKCENLRCDCETGLNNFDSNDSFVTCSDGDAFDFRLCWDQFFTRRRILFAVLSIAVFFCGYFFSMLFVSSRSDYQEVGSAPAIETSTDILDRIRM